MKRVLMLFLLVSGVLSFTTISLEGIPVQESPEYPQKIKIFLDIAGENELVLSVKGQLFEAFSNIENIDVVADTEAGISYVVSVVLVEARVGANKQKTGNIAACVQYIDYFDNRILKPDVAVSNWERVDNLTANLIEHSQTGIHLFPKNNLENVTNNIVSKFQKLFLEKEK